MKRHLASVLALVVVGMYVAVLAQKSDPEIQKVVDQYLSGFNKGDAKALTALYTSDALRITPDGRFLTGRAAIEKSYVEAFAGPYKGTMLRLQAGTTRALTADVALIEGTYEVTGGSTPVKGRYLNTLVRQAGAWKLASVVTVPEGTTPAK